MTLRRAIRRLAEMPGQRLIVLASPGFFAQTPEAISATAAVLDLAAKVNVTVSALDARGLYTAEPDASQGEPGRLWLQYRLSSAKANADVLTDLAEGTGGTFFHNNNDLTAGFERVAAAPEFSYLLGFSSAAKADGSFHSIKVRLANEKGVSVEARRGYYALKHDSDEQAASADVDDAVFSRNEISDIPVVLQTGYSKPNAGDPKVLVVAKVDVKWLHFQKADERSRDSLTVVSALFDTDGGYVTGNTNTVNLRLRDETLEHLEAIRGTAEVLDLAAKANVTINGLGARGVYLVEEEGDVTQRKAPSKLWVQNRRVSARANNDVLTELAESTGGAFFHNNNDLTAGFERVAAVPEFSYVLGFSPANLKLDGGFHSLKVRLPNEKGVSVEARRGYYALKHDSDEQAASADVDDAVFSRNEISDIPVVLQTGYSKPNAGDPKVLVVAKLDVKWLHFQKTDERSRTR